MDDVQMKSFLQQLYQMSGGDITSDVSMYVIGEHLGLDKTQAGTVAEDLIIDGFAELKTLAGGITITTKGLEELGKGTGSDDEEISFSVHVLGSGEVLGEDDQQAVVMMLDEIKQVLFGTLQKYGELEELVIDIKTIETQLLSPRPKTSVVKAVLASIAQQFQQHGDQLLLGQIRAMVGG